MPFIAASHNQPISAIRIHREIEFAILNQNRVVVLCNEETQKKLSSVGQVFRQMIYVGNRQ